MKRVQLLLTYILIHHITFGQCGITFSYANSVWCACTGSAIAIPTGTAPFHYLWSNGDTTYSIDSLCAGTYTITMTDSNGCIVTDSVIITQPLAMTFTISSTAVSCLSCNDACITTTAYGGCPPYNFVYSPFDPQPCQGIYDTTYTVTITDACNCSLTGSITPDTVPVGINDNQISEKIISIYPNPVTNEMSIVCYQLARKAEIEIYNVLGETVYKGETSNIKKEINVSGLRSGIYFVEVRNEQSAIKKKIIKL